MNTHALSSSRLVLLALTLSLAASLNAQSNSSNTSPQQSSAQDAPAPASSGSQVQPSSPEQPLLTIRQTVRRVILDVMVRDANGKPVHGLTANDFSISENGKPQKVLSFDVYDFDKPSISRGPNAAPLPPNVFINVPEKPERGPLYVFLYDLVNTDVDDQMSAHKEILKFIKGKPDGTRFAVFINSDELYLAQGFTTDKDALYALLDGKHARPHVPRIFMNGRNYGRGDPTTVIDILTHISQFLDGIPGRKNLIWVAGTFPAAIFAREGDPIDYENAIRAETNALAQAQVAIFPVNVRGVVVNCEGCMTGAMPHGGAGGQEFSLPPGQPAPNALSSPTASPVTAGARVEGKGSSSLNADFMKEDAIAESTGGRAFYDTNSLSEALETATEDGGNYYTLTYSPAGDTDDGKCHGISVRVEKAKYQLAYRRTYCRAPLVSAGGPGIASGPSALAVPIQAGDVLQANMKQGAPMLHDLIFSAHLHPDGPATMANSEEMAQLQAEAEYFMTHKKNKPPKPLPPTRVQKYAIEYRVFDPQFKAEAARSAGQAMLEFAIAAFDADGHTLNGVVNDGTPEESTQPGENKAGLYRVHQSLVVPVSAVSLRVGVRDRMSDRIGTLEVPLPLAPQPVAQAASPEKR